MEFIKRLDNTLTRFEQIIVVIFFTVMLSVIFLNTTTRVVINYSFAWADELPRYLAVWGSFIGASLAAKKHAHIGIDAFVTYLPQKLKKYARMLALLCSLLFCIGIIIVGFLLVMKQVGTGQMSPAMQIPMSIPYAAIPVGFLLMLYHYIVELITLIVHPEEFEADGGDLHV